MMEDGVGCRGCRPEAGVLSPDVGTGRMGLGNKSDGGRVMGCMEGYDGNIV